MSTWLPATLESDEPPLVYNARSLNIDCRSAELFILRQLQRAAHHHASAEVVEIDGRQRGQRVNVVACDVGIG